MFLEATRTFFCYIFHISIYYNELLQSSTVKKKKTQYLFSKINRVTFSIVAQWVKNLTSIYKDAVSIPGLAQWVKDQVLP